jgi:hypothetical protein
MEKKDSAPDASTTSSPDCSNLYYDPEVIHETVISGVPFKIKEMSGEEYTSIVDECTTGQGKINRKKYVKMLIEKSVVSPKDLDPKRLKAGAQTLLAKKIEDVLGMTEVVQKNLLEM